MTEKTLSRYAADNSGPFPKPYPGSQISPENRIHRIMNEGIDKALTGPGFDPKLQRFRKTLMSRTQLLTPTDGEWIEIPDLHKFIHHTVGLSLIQAIFGPHLVQLNPTFMDDLFEFEHWFPLLAKGVPSFIVPKAYAVRRRLHSHFKRWYAHARENFTESSIDPDGDGDPFWGSEWMRQRQKNLDLLQDEDSLAAGDLGVAWAYVHSTPVPEWSSSSPYANIHHIQVSFKYRRSFSAGAHARHRVRGTHHPRPK